MPTVPDDLPAGPRPMIAIVRAVPGHESQLAAAIDTLAPAVRAEPGCLEFRAFGDAANPGAFYLFEVYTDTSAFRAHLATAHVSKFLAEAAQHSTTDAGGLVQLVEFTDHLDDNGRA